MAELVLPKILGRVQMPVRTGGDPRVRSLRVLLVSDRLKVVGIHASLVRAEVVELEPHRDRLDDGLVDHPMCKLDPSMGGAEVTISRVCDVARPFPAVLAELNTLGED